MLFIVTVIEFLVFCPPLPPLGAGALCRAVVEYMGLDEGSVGGSAMCGH